jgi:chloramphenicol O-acetyltransferase type B
MTRSWRHWSLMRPLGAGEWGRRARKYREQREVRPLFEIGAYTYGTPQAWSWGEGARLYVGKYCSISSGVTVILGGSHRVDWATTYPFPVLMAHEWPEVSTIKGHPATRGDVVIGNDVWIGAEATILSGITIGDGAVVAAKSVVTKDVPPYAMVAGNPASVVRTRFDDDTIRSLLGLRWWDWPREFVRANVQALCAPPGTSELLGARPAERLREAGTHQDFENRIARLDCGLFDEMGSQSSEEERASWLALQRAVRIPKVQFTYLGIGPSAGGSILPFLLDPKCSQVFWTSKRNADSADARSELLRYRDSSIQGVVEELRAVAPGQLSKLVRVDTDVRDVEAAFSANAPDLCFIDGVQSTEAAVGDFRLCLRVCALDAVIYFRHAALSRPAIHECMHLLMHGNRQHVAYMLPGDTFAVALDGSPVNSDPGIREMATGGKWWLASTDFSDSVISAVKSTLRRIRNALGAFAG